MKRQVGSELFTTTIRLPVSTILQVDRLARDKSQKRNDILKELIEEGITSKRGMNKLRQIIEQSKTWLGDINTDKVIENIKGESLSLFEKAYLAYILDYQTRVNLFEKLKLKDELELSNTIDEVLTKSKTEKNDKITYNLHKIANLITINLRDFGVEYVRYYIGIDDIDKLMEIKPEIFPLTIIEEEEETKETESEKEVSEIEDEEHDEEEIEEELEDEEILEGKPLKD